VIARVSTEAKLLLSGRAIRAFADGFVAIILPVYLIALGCSTLQVGLLSTVTLFGSALATLAVGRWGHRFHYRRLLLGASILMAGTGLAFAGLSEFAPLLVVAFVGTLNPSSGDVSVFLPLEHARLAHAAKGADRTSLFARYSLSGALLAALGSLVAAVPDLAPRYGFDLLAALRSMFVAYACAGLAIWALYRHLPDEDPQRTVKPAPLRRSKHAVTRLAALFSVDAFAGGLLVQSLLALWLFKRFHLSLSAAAGFFFWTGLLMAFSQLAAPRIAARFGLLNTMVFTHIPSSLALIGAALSPRLDVALGLLLIRSALSQMDVPTRSAYVMALVSAEERTAAASVTAVPRSLAAAISPSLGGILFASGWLAAPLVACGVLKITYDLALLVMFRRHAIEEQV
jgi:MFS family permease